MILDNDLVYSVDQDLAVSASTVVSTNVINHGLIGSTSRANQISPGQPVRLFIVISETFTSGGSATLAVAVQQDTVVGFGSPTTLWTSATLALGTLVLGYRFAGEIPGFVTADWTEQYTRLTYTIATATTTAGKITAGLISDLQSNDVNTP